MTQFSIANIRQWLKTSPHPLARSLFALAKRIRNPELPAPKLLFRLLHGVYMAVSQLLGATLRIVWWTPLFKSQLSRCGSNLYLYGGLPYQSGPLDLCVGRDCRISAHSTFSGRTCAPSTPTLVVGNNVDIGWMTTIAVGSRVLIGDNVRIAGRALLAGYPGHPLDAEERAAGMAEHDHQVGDIVLEPDVWLATGVSVMAGVTIGRGTVVAAGSVVTHDLPPGVLAAGIPAKVIKVLNSTAASARKAA
ncbi:acetyltransferase [Bacterioplanes sanyensis]|uniref:Acetyltransferase n=1 Tax=Bacterioplanes sanyensis TaxID=1249553 RepID=A0A222FMP7_9GAMM|nr:acyltransferase [Bacterioplanes sanyensis]ASP39651.1 acetyltransferase [Bacterioplanes sanyensis]